ncbi:MAG: stage III sporulation protein AD [Clostridia bacterium]|nr:stage III sporulation protein AD [Clostridia bacterium]
MSVLSVILAALVATFIAVTLRGGRPELGALFALAAGCALLLALVAPLVRAVDLLRDVALRAHVDVYYVGVVLRIVGLAYLAQFASQVARDAGEGALAAKVELAGRVGILLVAAPVILDIVEVVLRLLAEARS